MLYIYFVIGTDNCMAMLWRQWGN